MKSTIKKLSLAVAIFALLSVFSLVSFAADEFTSGDYTYVVLEDDTAKITGYNGSEEICTLPSELDGKKVTVLGEYAFRANKAVKSLVVPDSVETVERAFSINEVLESIELGKGVKNISDSAFYTAWALKSITVSEENEYFSSSDGILYNKDKTVLINVPYNKNIATFEIPGTVTVLDKSSIRTTHIKSLVIPSSVTKIEGYAITDGLFESLVIPGSVETIENHAVYMCNNLRSVEIEEGNLKVLENSAIYNCGKLETISIPSNVESIGMISQCFALKNINVDSGNKKYKSQNGVLYSADMKTLVKFPQGRTDEWFRIPSGVTKIANNAFYEAMVKKIYIPSTVKTIEELAFAYSYSELYCEVKTMPAGFKDALDGRKVVYGYSLLGTTTSLTATQSTSQIKLTWNAVKGAEGYRIYQYLSGAWKQIATTTATTKTFTGITSGKKVRLAVRAYATQNGKTVLGESYREITTSTKAGVPTTYEAVPGTKTMKLTWNKVTGATGYRLYYYSASKKGWKEIKTVTANTYNVSGLKSGTNYEFAVKPYIQIDDTVIWSSYSTYKATTKCEGPTSYTASHPSTTKIKLTWNKVTGAAGYRLYYYNTSSKSWKEIKTLTTNTYTVSALKAGTEYKFAVKPYAKTGSTTLWGEYTTFDTAAACAVPKTYEAVPGTKTMKLTWNKVAGATGYKLYYYNTSTKSWKAIKTITTNTYNVSGLKAGTSYEFAVKPYKQVGDNVIWSSYSTYKTMTKCEGPTSYTASHPSTTKITLTWNKVKGATGYRLYYYNTSSNSWKTIKTLTANTYTVSALTAGTEYKFAVKPYTKTGSTTLWGEFTTFDTAAACDVPTTFEADPATTTMKLTWNSVKGADGYRLYYYSASKKGWKEIKTITANTYNVSGLKSDTVYTFAVKPYKKVGDNVIWSSYSTYAAATEPTQEDVGKYSRYAKYMDIIAKGEYYMLAYNEHDSGADVEETIVGLGETKNNYSIYEFSSMGEVRIVYNNSKKTLYLVSDTYKTYQKASEYSGNATYLDLMLTLVGFYKHNYKVTSSLDEIDGITVVRDTFTDKSTGVRYSYYFAGGELVEIEVYWEDEAGELRFDKYYVLSFTNTAEQELFTIPSNYKLVK